MHDMETGMSDPNLGTITWGYVLARSYGLYAQRFWTYFRIALLPAVVVSGFHFLEKSVYPRLFHALPRWSPKFVLLGVFQGWSEGRSIGRSAPSSLPPLLRTFLGRPVVRLSPTLTARQEGGCLPLLRLPCLPGPCSGHAVLPYSLQPLNFWVVLRGSRTIGW
jgi:hypothetical protein